jgi:uncharacterized phage-associated protein
MRALTAAKYLIGKSRSAAPGSEASRMSPLKLQKILFFAQGWHLGIYGKPLFDDPVLAWKFGPVVQDVYATFRHFGDQNIAMTDWHCSTGAQVTDPEDKAFLDRIFAEYAVESASDLVERTHNTDPWLDAWGSPLSRVIPLPAMERYFGGAG